VVALGGVRGLALVIYEEARAGQWVAAGAGVIGIAAAVMLRKPSPQPGPAPVPTASTAVSTTAPVSTAAPAPPGQGVLLLSASPWGDIDKIVDEKGTPVALDEEDRSTPARIDLAPGKYSVTISGPAGKTDTFPVEITAGQRVPVTRNLGGVDINALEKEVQKQ
jgi:hypothetical protein